jgi:serine/threonine protein kinase
MSTTTAEAPKKNRTVLDQHGQSYELTGRIGEGGQGSSARPTTPTFSSKLRATTEEKRASWTNKIRALMRQPLEGLPIAHPLALITQPQPGYVMELMDGLAPMTELMQVATDALMSDDGLSGYVKTGGLLRRLKMLARLARVLAELHGRGLWRSLSCNVFASQSLEYAEVWLIDADNVASQSRDGQQGVFTPDYGAPEILRGESGINTLTDSWSFAVMAYRILTLVHPLKGDVVLEGEPEREEAALRGELPWVDHPVDRSNALSIGLPREITLNAPLRALFERCFNAGLNSPGERPSLSEWADAFEAATGHCDQCESCGSTFFYTKTDLSIL